MHSCSSPVPITPQRSEQHCWEKSEYGFHASLPVCPRRDHFVLYQDSSGWTPQGVISECTSDLVSVDGRLLSIYGTEPCSWPVTYKGLNVQFVVNLSGMIGTKGIPLSSCSGSVPGSTEASAVPYTPKAASAPCVLPAVLLYRHWGRRCVQTLETSNAAKFMIR